MATHKLYIGVDDKVYKDGTPLADVAKWNEYGTELIPPRPSFRMGAEKSIKKNTKNITAYLQTMAQVALSSKKVNKKQIDKLLVDLLDTIGEDAVKQTKKIIQSGETVNNAPATVKKKGFDHPLYETGFLLKNVEFIIGKK